MVMGDLPTEAEVLVVGGGPGGYAAAFRAAELGLDVSLVSDEDAIGGVCLLRGCIPSKTLLYLAELVHMAEEAREMGLGFGAPDIDLDGVRAFRDGVVEQLTGGLETLASQHGVRLLRGRARFEGRDAMRIQNGDAGTVRFRHAILATGSRPVALPGTSFSERVMDSARALELADVPERLLVVGGGYIGLELGTVYATLGSAVTLVEMTDRLLPQADPDLVEPLAAQVAERFDEVLLGTRVTDVEETGDAVSVQLSGGGGPTGDEDGDQDNDGREHADTRRESFDRILVAIGREPAGADLELDTAGIETGDRGFVTVDAQRRTSVDSIYAVGDLAGGSLLAHEAIHEGQVAAEVIARRPAAFDARAVPAVVYTDPQVAWCGLTERQAADEGREVRVSRFPWRASGRAVSVGAANGVTKILSDPESDIVLGVGITGRHAESLIAEGVLAVEMGARLEDLSLAVHPHPTLSETIGEAAGAPLRRAVHLRSRR
jgi:dihydrolipoamide dehydrogenase